MGRSQVLYNRTSARMRAARGRGRGRGGDGISSGGRAAEGERRPRHQSITSTPLVPAPQEPSSSFDAIDVDRETFKDEEAERLLDLDSATSAFASRIPVHSHLSNNIEATSLRTSSSIAETEALCSKMAKALETLPRAEQMRLPEHFVEMIHGKEQTRAQILGKDEKPLVQIDSIDHSLAVASSVAVASSSADTVPIANTTSRPIPIDLTNTAAQEDVVYLGTKQQADASTDAIPEEERLESKSENEEEEDLDSWLDSVISE